MASAPPAPRGRSRPRSIALDGPAAAGKTSVGLRLAARLGMLCFDTGLIYRALTVAALRAGVATDDAAGLVALCARAPIELLPEPGSPGGSRVTVGGEDVTDALRLPEVDARVSAVSSHAAVRASLLEAQRRIAAIQPIVMLGRDIGTVVLPEADLKLYLDASAEARARRRFRERLARGEPVVYAEILARMQARDAQDRGRAVAPLRAAPDAVVVDSDRCDVEQVVALLIALAERWPDRLTREGGRLTCEPGEGEAA